MTVCLSSSIGINDFLLSVSLTICEDVKTQTQRARGSLPKKAYIQNVTLKAWRERASAVIEPLKHNKVALERPFTDPPYA